MRPFCTNDSLKPRGLSSAPNAQVLEVGGILPGIPDIPYIHGEFYIEDVFFPRNGERPRISHAVVPANSTFWALTTEESLALATGGVLQILSFDKEQPVLYPCVAHVGFPPAELPALEAMAKAVVVEVLGPTAWEDMTTEVRQRWLSGLATASKVFLHYQRRAQYDSEPPKEG